ncbi:T9SS type A sorting domain-containing protein [Cytophagales bacterium LB-30]|uniref:T9SS type A sorting domain-containing protein n=1 Tax=Shiella aurantiaca TaxID=3058365 RepID=A0ABT8F0A3_9BACT|nr:T9SS type A sorting domain-containing protein [Shiella aurantiaca]MDN4163875.1 T9SS type A sorting domain-containing protein [Shiella aurantiaca]
MKKYLLLFCLFLLYSKGYSQANKTKYIAGSSRIKVVIEKVEVRQNLGTDNFNFYVNINGGTDRILGVNGSTPGIFTSRRTNSISGIAALPLTLYEHNYTNQLPEKITIYAYGYRKNCFARGGDSNGSDSNYKSECYCGDLGLRCEEYDDDYRVPATGYQLKDINFKEMATLPTPGEWQTGSFDLGSTYRIHYKWMWTPPTVTEIKFDPAYPSIEGNRLSSINLCADKNVFAIAKDANVSNAKYNTEDLTYKWFYQVDGGSWRSISAAYVEKTGSLSDNTTILLKNYPPTAPSGASYKTMNFKVEIHGPHAGPLNSLISSSATIYPATSTMEHNFQTHGTTYTSASDLIHANDYLKITNSNDKGSNNGKLQILKMDGHKRHVINLVRYQDEFDENGILIMNSTQTTSTIQYDTTINFVVKGDTIPKTLTITKEQFDPYTGLAPGRYSIRYLNYFEPSLGTWPNDKIEEMCTGNAFFWIKEPLYALSPSASSPKKTNGTYNSNYEISCHGAADASIRVSFPSNGGGIGQKSIYLQRLNAKSAYEAVSCDASTSNGVTTLSNLAPGTYRVQVIDEVNNEKFSSNITIYQPDLLKASLFLPETKQGNGNTYHTTCYNADTVIRVKVEGGNGIRTVKLNRWDGSKWVLQGTQNVASTASYANFSVTPIGLVRYQVLVSDQMNCSISPIETELRGPESALNYSGGTKSNYNTYNVSAYEARDGSISFTLSGGVGGYSTLANGASVEIINNSSVTKPTVSVSNNELTVTNIQANKGDTKLQYVFKVKDELGCVMTIPKTGHIEFNFPPKLIGSHTITGKYGYVPKTVDDTTYHAACANEKLSVTVTIKGGISGAYLQLYQNDTPKGDSVYVTYNNITGNGYTFTNLSAGKYSYTITDRYKVRYSSSSFRINTPETPLSISNIMISTKPNGYRVSCSGASDAEIKAVVKGGVGNRTFLLNGSSSYTPSFRGDTVVYNNLPYISNGYYLKYRISVEDELGCSVSTPISESITPPDPVRIVTFNPNNTNRYGSNYYIRCGREAYVTFTMDLGSYEYVKVGLFKNGAASPLDTFGITPSGFSYNPTFQSINLEPGSYELKVIAVPSVYSSCALPSSKTFYLLAPKESLKIENSRTVVSTDPLYHVSCRDGADGEIVVSSSGGWEKDSPGNTDTQYILYKRTGSTTWTSIDTAFTANPRFSGLAALDANEQILTYKVAVVEKHIVTQCIVETPVITLNAPPAFSASLTLSDYSGYAVSCPGGNDGSITLSASGGTGRFDYRLSGYTLSNGVYSALPSASFQLLNTSNTSHTFSGLRARTQQNQSIYYTATVTDDLGCVRSSTEYFTLSQPEAIQLGAPSFDEGVVVGTLVPYHFICGAELTNASFEITGGRYPITLTLSNPYGYSVAKEMLAAGAITFQDLDTGRYTLRVSQQPNGIACSVSPLTFSLSRPKEELSVSIASPTKLGSAYQVSCRNGSDGVIAVQESGGWQAEMPHASTLQYTLLKNEGNGYAEASLHPFNTGTHSFNNIPALTGSGQTILYKVRIKETFDGSICVRESNEISLSAPELLNLSALQMKTYGQGYELSCYGASDAELQVEALGGLAPYQFNLLAYVQSSGGAYTGASENLTQVKKVVEGSKVTFTSIKGHNSQQKQLFYKVQVSDALGCTYTTSSFRSLYEPEPIVLGAPAFSTEVETINGNHFLQCEEASASVAFAVSGGHYPMKLRLYNTAIAYTQSVELASPGLAEFHDLTRDSGDFYRLEVVDDIFACAFPTTHFRLKQAEQELVLQVDPLEKNTVFHVSCPEAADGIVRLLPEGGWQAEFPTETVMSYTLYHFVQGDWKPHASVYERGGFENLAALDSVGNTIRYLVRAEENYLGSICSVSSQEFHLQAPDALQIAAWEVSDANGYSLHCFESEDGSIAVQTQGGVFPQYVKLRRDGQLIAEQRLASEAERRHIFSGLSIGTYVLEVSDTLLGGEACPLVFEENITLTQPSPLMVSLASQDSLRHPLCTGSNDGYLRVAFSGGVALENGDYLVRLYRENVLLTEQEADQEALLTMLTSGDYSVEIEDRNGCITTLSSIQLEDPSLLEIEAIEVRPPSCDGGSNGEITVRVIGGTPWDGQIYDIALWEKGTQDTLLLRGSSVTFSNLEQKVYGIEVKDRQNCLVLTEQEILPRPDPLLLLPHTTQLSTCPSTQDGALVVEAVGGDGPYLFSTDGANYVAGNVSDKLFQWQGLTGGRSYTFYVKDANYREEDHEACIVPYDFYLPRTDSLYVSFDVQHVSCKGGTDGQIIARPGRGNDQDPANFVFTWMNLHTGRRLSAQTHQLTEIGVGEYRVSYYHKDYPTCVSGGVIVAVNEPSQDFAITQVETFAPTCGNVASGWAHIRTEGGWLATSYQYSLDGSAYRRARLESGLLYIPGLTPGNHALSIRGLHQESTVQAYCESEVSLSVPRGSYAITLANTQAVSCAGTNNGSFQLNSPLPDNIFYVQNSEGDIQSNTTGYFSGLGSGNYTTWAEQSGHLGLGCQSDTLAISIGSPEVLSFASLSATPSSVCHPDGRIQVQGQGGTPSYQLLISNLSGEVFGDTDLPAGQYWVRLTDANLCSIDSLVTIGTLSELNLSTQVENEYCGQGQGRLEVIAEGGEGPYTYYLSNEAAANPVWEGLGAGQYSIRVVDQRGCSKEQMIWVRNENTLSMEISDVLAASCGQANGEARINVSGGFAPYRIILPDGSESTQEEQIVSGLLSGIYEIAVEDAKGCRLSQILAISDKEGPEIISVKLMETYCGLALGEIQLQVAGGTPPYAYRWSDSDESTDNRSQLSAGNYSVLITDSRGCQASASYEIQESVESIQTNASISEANCGIANGSIQVDVQGGFPPYQYQWEGPSDMSETESHSLVAGEYTLTLTDAKGCSQTRIYEVGEKSDPSAVLISQSHSIEGFPTGNIVVKAQEGFGSYRYLWSNAPNLNQAFANDLRPGNYWVLVQDAGQCTSDTLKVTIESVASTLSLQATIGQLPACPDATDGKVTLLASGGTPPYRFYLNDKSQSALPSFQTLSEGTYVFGVEDAIGVSREQTLHLAALPNLELDVFSEIHPSCYEAHNGYLEVKARGGDGNYTYEWSTGDTRESISDLPAGAYSVTVRGRGGCSVSQSFTLEEPETLSPEVVQITSPTCVGANDGILEIVAKGGTGPYTYLWATGEQGKRRQNLAAGTYALTIKDAQGCEWVEEIALPEKPSITVEAVFVQPPSCMGGNDGSIRISVQNARDPLIRWSGGQVGLTARGLAAGAHTVVVLDADGCTSEHTFALDEPQEIRIDTQSLVHNSCYGGAEGEIHLTLSGGTAPYSYLWNNGANSATLSALKAGTYQVKVRDAKGCTQNATFTIKESLPIQVNKSETQAVSCANACDGAVDLQVSGGSGSLQVLWPDGFIGTKREGLCAGSYWVNIRDTAACSFSYQVVITEPKPLLAEVSSIKTTSCFGASDGALQLVVSGGTQPYTYQWNNGASTQHLENIPSGQYSVVVSDANGCTLKRTFTVPSHNALSLASIQETNPSCYLGADGSIELVVSGGVLPYQYQWNTGASTSRIYELSAGIYSVSVTDANGCILSSQFELDFPQPVIIEGVPRSVELCAGGEVEIDAGNWSSYSWTSTRGFQSNQRMVQLSEPAIYQLTVFNSRGCSDTQAIEVTVEGDAIDADFLVMSEAIVGDTLVLVDITWPLPDSVMWYIPEGAELLRTLDYRAELLFHTAGSYPVRMRAYTEGCLGEEEKQILVSTQQSRANAEERSSRDQVAISQSILYPNPNRGKFALDVVLSTKGEVVVEVFNLLHGNPIARMRDEKVERKVFEFDIPNLKSGMYLIQITTKDEIKMLRFIVQ